MNDSLLQMNTFFPNELMAIESIYSGSVVKTKI